MARDPATATVPAACPKRGVKGGVAAVATVCAEIILACITADPALGSAYLDLQIRDSSAFAGVHLIPVTRYREVAARLEQRLA